MKVLIVNGPNLNLLGVREKSVYGNRSFEEYLPLLRARYPQVELAFFQSNVEGELINCLQEHGFGKSQAIIFNPGGYTHTSVALADTLAALRTPVIEVHLSNLYAREEYRQVSLTARHCRGAITGFGLESYELALLAFLTTPL